MSKLTLTQFAADDAVLSVTEHDTLTEALNEFAGWEKAGSVRYMVQGTMTVDCVCKRTMESRNRNITLELSHECRDEEGIATGEYVTAAIPLKAPQACKMLHALHEPTDLVYVSVTNTEFNIG